MKAIAPKTLSSGLSAGVLLLVTLTVVMPSFAAESPSAFNVLLVDDFPSATFDWKGLWEETFKAAGVSCEVVAADEVKKPGQMGNVKLKDYAAVIWHTGIEEEETLTEADRMAIAAYLENGGKLLLTGTGPVHELVKAGRRSWVQRYLRCDYLMPNSPIVKGSIYEFDTLTGCEGSIFQGLRFQLDQGESGTYAVHNPKLIYEDVDATAGGGGAVPCLRFANITGNLGVQFEGPILPGAPPCRVLVITFPLETAHPASVRTELITRALKFFAAPQKQFYELRGNVAVEDKSKPPLEDATVSLKGSTYRTLSRKDGSFVLSGIPAGTYELEVSLFRYEPKIMESVKIPTSTPARLDIMLNPKKTPLTEGRGIWVVRTQMNSPENIEKVVERCAAAGFNAIFAQVRGRGDAYYKSATEPRAESLKDQPEDFDPLGLIIKLAHAKNIEVHAWMNACYAYSSDNPREPYSPKHILARHPEWALTNRAGKSLLDYARAELREHNAEGVFLSPCIPECRAYLADVYLEVVKNYDIDGIHFDFIRFPFAGASFDDPWALGFGPLTRKAFKEEHGIDPLEIDPKDSEKVQLFNDWRRLCVSRLVEEVNKRAHEEKPGIRVSAAVLERYHLARASHCYQDWIEWLQNGKIDTCCIMAYNTDNPLVQRRIRMAVENQGKGTLWAGMSANWRRGRESGVIESMQERVEMVRREKPEGVMFFAYTHFDDEEIKALREGPFDVPAVVPSVRP